ncbi:MAG: DNA-directed RNA polymerase subunit omega [Lachnospiraceae bacterium]|nr:DNA-directed RNA polymerase subunit omega [Lachnospiraceae bacterium]MDD3795130.1 DNA-directed RNA polymerase subunit omega [Lachnospiraceae bacterium]
MLHPSYTDLMKVVNSDVVEGDTPVVNSRYSIVMATAKRARQIIAGQAAVTPLQASKPLSTAVAELEEGKIKIMPEDPEEEVELEKAETMANARKNEMNETNEEA